MSYHSSSWGKDQSLGKAGVKNSPLGCMALQVKSKPQFLHLYNRDNNST